jgi:hypothetical protein
LSVLSEFDSIVQQHLESNWHQVGFKTKQLLKEIKTLRDILNSSLEYDAISFYNYMKLQIEDAQGLSYHSSAYWLLSDSANVLVEVAKERALAAEPNPKWKVLQNIVEECEQFRISKKSNRPLLILTDCRNSIVSLSALICLGMSEYMGRISKVFVHQDRDFKRLKTEEALCSISSIKEIFDTEKNFSELSLRNIIMRTSDSIDFEALRIINPLSIVMFSPNLQILREIEVIYFICNLLNYYLDFQNDLSL